MVQTMKEYQKEYFEKEGYTIIDNMENAISAFCERYPQHTNVAEESILNDTNCDWVVLNDGSVAVMLVSRVNKALQRAGQQEKAEAWNREYKEQQDYEAVWELARKYVTII